MDCHFQELHHRRDHGKRPPGRRIHAHQGNRPGGPHRLGHGKGKPGRRPGSTAAGLLLHVRFYRRTLQRHQRRRGRSPQSAAGVRHLRAFFKRGRRDGPARPNRPLFRKPAAYGSADRHLEQQLSRQCQSGHHPLRHAAGKIRPARAAAVHGKQRQVGNRRRAARRT